MSVVQPFLKRKSFEHEREVRVLLWSHTPNKRETAELMSGKTHILDFSTAKPGLELPIDLRSLIDSVYISPESPSWLVEPVQELLRKSELPDVVVRRSQLYDEAIL